MARGSRSSERKIDLDYHPNWQGVGTGPGSCERRGRGGEYWTWRSAEGPETRFWGKNLLAPHLLEFVRKPRREKFF
ncbi:hypothetical protein F2P81_004138 [Scophthalmus maximus]|uniref:Uncharacterized protein n=1 Tax=Scophthalmus maximus TaxID=52904 RepID=A0A6A4TIV3_SCOMX|nr:hypothetical protein F2P81_004138 [Scophthalmus maximus]